MNIDELERKHKAFMRYDGNDVVSLLIHAGELQTELLAEVERLREWIYHHAKNLDAVPSQRCNTFADEAREAIGVKEGEVIE